MTAAHKVKDFDLPVEEALERIRMGLDVTWRWKNTLYLEWFSIASGRVSIHAANNEIQISTPV
jgi:hypothetical protein